MTKNRSATSNYKKPVRIAAAINFQAPENLYQNASPSLKQHLNKKNIIQRNTTTYEKQCKQNNKILEQSESSSDQQGDAARYSKHLLQISRIVTDIVPAKNKIVQSRQADFWLAKGFSQAQRGHFQSAIDCYKHGLRLQNSHFDCSFNLGCCYEKMKKLSRALKWFHSASNSNPQSPQAYYALSLCAYKLGMYEDSHEYIIKARDLQIAVIQNKSGCDSVNNASKNIHQTLSGRQMFSNRTSENQEVKRLWFNIAYMCALCERKLKNYQQAEKQFMIVNDELKKRYSEFTKRQIFGMLLLPFQYDRQMLHDNLDKLKAIEQYFSLDRLNTQNGSSIQNSTSENRRSKDKQLSPGMRKASKAFGVERKSTYIMGFGGQYQSSQINIWKDSSKLINLSFFKRFTIEQLEKVIIPQMEVKQYESNSVLFIQNDQVAVVISGVILMRCHRDSVVSPKFMAKYVSGDIIGYSLIDQGTTRKHQNWFTIICKAQIASFPLSAFGKIWELQKSIEKEIQRSVLETHQIFKHFSIQSLYLLCYQLLEKRSFYSGELIAMQSKSSKFNNRFSQAFKPRVSSISISLKRIQQQRVKKQDQSLLDSNPNISPSPQKQSAQSIRSLKNQNIRPNRNSIYNQSPSFSPFLGPSSAGDNRSMFSGQKSNNMASRRNSKRLLKIHQHPQDVTDSEFEEEIKNKRKIRVKQTEIDDKIVMGGGGVSSGTASIVSGFDRGTNIGGLKLDQDLDQIEQRDGFYQYFEKGIYIIEKGQAFIENPIDCYHVANISRGDFLGEQQYFKEHGFCHYGDIFAAQDQVVCHFINFEAVKRIQNWEIEKLRAFSGARKSIQKLKYTCEMRYVDKNSIGGKKIY